MSDTPLSVAQIAPQRILPVLVIQDIRSAAPLRDALKAGGLRSAEITFRTDAALEAIRVFAEDPELIVGAGTVTTPAQAESAKRSGASFVVSPGLSPAVVGTCQELGMLCLPGVATATEIMHARELGLTELKFFPAESAGGTKAISALSAPFPDVTFVPTGGVSLTNMPGYLSITSVSAVGGSWLATAAMLRDGDFLGITDVTVRSIAAAQAV